MCEGGVWVGGWVGVEDMEKITLNKDTDFTPDVHTQERLQQRLRVLGYEPASPSLPSIQSVWPLNGNYRTYKGE